MKKKSDIKYKKKYFDNNGVVIIKNLVPKEIIGKCLRELNNFKNYSLPEKKKHIVFDKYKSRKYIKYFQYLNNIMNQH